MNLTKVDKIRALLKSIETGDPGPISVVNQSRYVQHNPQTHEGSEGLEALFKRLSLTKPKVNVVRAFEDGDFVFGHTEYDFSRRRIGFEVFRFEGEQVVEHWDNIQPREGPNVSGRSMVDGPAIPSDLDQTEANRKLANSFVSSVLIEGNVDEIEHFTNGDNLLQHDANFGDGTQSLKASLSRSADTRKHYETCHRILACGDFTLAVIEGHQSNFHRSFYEMFRWQDGHIVEHWNTVETVPPREKWKNSNGKF